MSLGCTKACVCYICHSFLWLFPSQATVLLLHIEGIRVGGMFKELELGGRQGGQDQQICRRKLMVLKGFLEVLVFRVWGFIRQ